MHFRRSFQDWELEEVTRFLGYISALKIHEREDSLVWKNDGRESLMSNRIIGL